MSGSRINKQTVQSFPNSIPDVIFSAVRLESQCPLLHSFSYKASCEEKSKTGFNAKACPQNNSRAVVISRL
jgi:hypothetical protein